MFDGYLKKKNIFRWLIPTRHSPCPEKPRPGTSSIGFGGILQETPRENHGPSCFQNSDHGDQI
jgi:hypothetical protein